MGLTSDERQKIKLEIQKLIKTCEADIIDLKEQCKPISPENAIGRVSRMEAINSKSVAEAALRRTKRKLDTLKVAFGKIDNPEFGTCKNCGETIQAGRIMLMPDSPYCVRCA